MTQGSDAHGFTIVEVLVVLAISIALLASSMLIIGGRQAKAQFTQSINDTKLQIDDVINNVASGYYASNTSTNFTCDASGAGIPVIGSGGSTGQGSHIGCVFVGRALQFNVGGDASAMYVYNIIARQYNDYVNKTPVTSWAQAFPVLLSPSSTPGHGIGGVDTTEKRTLSYGLQIKTFSFNSSGGGVSVPDGDHKIVRTSGSCSLGPCVADVAFVNNVSSTDTSNNLSSGALNVSLAIIKNTGMTNPGYLEDTMVDSLWGGTAANFFPADVPNALVNSVSVCFEGGQNQNGTITIGGNGRQLSTSLQVGQGACP